MKTHSKPEHIPEGYFYKHPSTIWEQIKEEILAAIICGDLQQGDKAPSLTEVTINFNCSRSTAQKVLESLCEAKILYIVPGRGLFVNKAKEVIEQATTEYKESMEYLLQRYIAMGKRIKMTDEQILNEFKRYLNEEQD
ncbi:MAG: GntR family transcriptional regulator [Acetatifactor sp.]|nr:GntR family transcriptional regulator [Acetatifactor sp.]